MKITKKSLERLPELITLGGFGMTKAVFLDDKLLTAKPPETLGFDWGVHSDKSKHLANTILTKVSTARIANLLYNSFSEAIIAAIVDSNFRVEIKFKEAVMALAGYYDEPRHPDYFITKLELKLPKIEAKSYSNMGVTSMPVDRLSEDIGPIVKKITFKHNPDGSVDIA